MHKPASLCEKNNRIYIAIRDNSDGCRLDWLLDRMYKDEDIENYWYCVHPEWCSDLAFGEPEHYHYLIEVNGFSYLHLLEPLLDYLPRFTTPSVWLDYVTHDISEGVTVRVFERQECC